MMPTIEEIRPLISRRTRSIITTLAIALNLLIIAFFLLVQLDLNDTSLIRHLRKVHTRLKRKHSKEEWATINPKTNQLGAPVILMQAPQPTAPQKKQPTKTQQTTAQKTAPSFDKLRMSAEKQEKKPTIANAKNTQNKSSDTKKLKQTEPTQLIENVKTTAKSKTQEKNKSTSLEQAIKAALAKKLKGAASNSAQDSWNKTKEEKSATINAQHNVQKIVQQQPKPKLTFAQLVKGFTEHLKTEGEYTISMQGKSGAKATEHQLRVGRFLQKIIQCMQTAWKVNRGRYPLNHRVLASIVVRVVINKDGSLANLIIQQTSGRQILDKFVLDILKDASKSFPPIPHYLNQEICVITCNWEKIPLPDGPTGYTITR